MPLTWSGRRQTLPFSPLDKDNAKAEQVTLIGGAARLHPGPYVLKIEGSKLLGTSL
jgi:hypothetical protein